MAQPSAGRPPRRIGYAGYWVPSSCVDVSVGTRAVGVARLGESDCEVLGDAWLAQPVNAITSLAFVVVAAGIAVAAVRAPVDRRRSAVFAVGVAAIGVGSFLYHGPQPPGSQEVHDLPILLTVTSIAIWNLCLVTRLVRNDLLVLGLAAVVFGAVTAVEVRLVPALTGLVIGAAVGLELVAAGRRLRPVDRRRRGHTDTAMIAMAALAATALLLGRTGSPLCDPGSTFQLHGLWHLASSALLALWWRLRFGRPSAAPTADLVPASPTASTDTARYGA